MLLSTPLEILKTVPMSLLVLGRKLLLTTALWSVLPPMLVLGQTTLPKTAMGPMLPSRLVLGETLLSQLAIRAHG
jgi:hypothetical protein